LNNINIDTKKITLKTENNNNNNILGPQNNNKNNNNNYNKITRTFGTLTKINEPINIYNQINDIYQEKILLPVNKKNGVIEIHLDSVPVSNVCPIPIHKLIPKPIYNSSINENIDGYQN